MRGSTQQIFSFSGNEISRYINLTILNCKLIENVLQIFSLGQSCCNHCILRQRTSLKLSGHTKFLLRKKYQGCFQLSTIWYSQTNVTKDLILRKREKSLVQILSQHLKPGFFKTVKISKK